MHYDEKSPKWKLWLIFTFRPYRHVFPKSMRELCKGADCDEEYTISDYAPFVEFSQWRSLNIIGKVCLVPLVWILAAAWNVLLFMFTEILIRIGWIVIAFPAITIFVLIRGLFLRFPEKSIRQNLARYDSKCKWFDNSVWSCLNYSK